MRRTLAFLFALSLSLPASAYHLVEITSQRDDDARIPGSLVAVAPEHPGSPHAGNAGESIEDAAVPSTFDTRKWALVAAGVVVLILGSRHRSRNTRTVRFPARRR
jgi:hypothetical protein